MPDKICVFEIDLNYMGSDELYDKIHLLGYDVFQVSHLATEYLYDDETEFESDVPVEIGAIRKIAGIKNICNPFFALDMVEEEQQHNHNEFDGSRPIEIGKKLPDEAVMSFKCSCQEQLRVPQGFFPYVICPNCENKILRREIVDAGGIYIYKKLDDGKK